MASPQCTEVKERPGEESSDECVLSATRPASEDLVGFSLRPAEPQTVGGRYEVQGCLGEGGTAVVHLARDTKSGELVVIKIMKPEIAATPELRERFLFEAHALQRVDHPSVVQILDISDSDEAYSIDEPPFLVLEALPGESLGDYLKRHESMPIEMAVTLMREAAVALSAVHKAELIHRDIKPDNIYLVGSIDAPCSVKVLDFGMAHALDEGHDEESTSILGTAQYMAPEQILVEPIDARTDIYGLGVVLFRALTGYLPFDDVKNKHHLLRHQLFSPVPPASWLKEEISPALERLIHRCTRKSPQARYETMDELVRAFDDALEAGAQSGAFVQDSAPKDPFGEISEIDPDIYVPMTKKGRKAAEVLAVEFGIYSRPQRSWPPDAGSC